MPDWPDQQAPGAGNKKRAPFGNDALSAYLCRTPLREQRLDLKPHGFRQAQHHIHVLNRLA